MEHSSPNAHAIRNSNSVTCTRCSRYYSVTQMLFELRIVSFNTLLTVALGLNVHGTVAIIRLLVTCVP